MEYYWLSPSVIGFLTVLFSSFSKWCFILKWLSISPFLVYTETWHEMGCREVETCLFFFFFPICLNSDDCRAETSKWLFHKQSVMTYQEAKKSCLIRGSIVAISSNTLISQHSSDVISTHRHHYRCIPQQVWNLVGFKAAGQEKWRFCAPLRKAYMQWRLHSGLVS